MNPLKNYFSLLIASFLIFLAIGCSNTNSRNEDSLAEEGNVDTVYDEELANELGADQYGMHQYVMAFLKAGPNRGQDSTRAAELQRAHLDNIWRMAEEGTLVLAGPFMDDGEIRGIYVFDVQTIEEAQKLTATDPAVQVGRLVMELHPWYGSAALMKVNEIHSQISRENP